MKTFLMGILIGIILNFFLFELKPGAEIYAEFYHSLDNLHKSRIFTDKNADPAKFFFKKDDYSFLIDGNGNILKKIYNGISLTSFSGSGEYFVKYEKVGSEIEFYNINEDKFWKLKSLEYPNLSYSGKIILLVNGDNSNVRIVDRNGNETGKINIRGKLCNIVSFSTGSDYSGLGFADGNYYVLNDKGVVAHNGKVPSGNIVKSMAVSANGLFAVTHFGDNERDSIRLINIIENKFIDVPMKESHPVKMPVHVNRTGDVTLINANDITRYRNNGRIYFTIQIPQRKNGISSIDGNDALYAAAYSMSAGGSKLIFFKDNGGIIFSKEFPAESFLLSSIIRDHLFVRGSANLYCYSVHQ